jgi:hypothetical protein
MSVSSIFDTYSLSEDEYKQLDDKFGRLCYKIVWELKRKNTKNNYTEDLEDVMQELRISMLRAGCYYKRQTYLEDCMTAARRHVKDPFLSSVVKELRALWKKRTRHGANKQKFGDHQEVLLERIVSDCVPAAERPQKNRRLRVDKKFNNYCKAITWNCQKNLGKKITRERHLRSGLVSLSEHSYLCEDF